MIRDLVFISYSHLDTYWFNLLKSILGPDIRNDRIVAWDDEQIRTGDDWYQRILATIDRAKIAILLVSPNFLNSEFIMNEELPRITQAGEQGLTIVWIPLFGSFKEPDIRSQYEQLTKYQSALDPNQPLETLAPENQKSALVKICRDIQRILQQHPSFIQNMPFSSLGNLFKGRSDMLDSLEEKLHASRGSGIIQPQAIIGLGGVGKTRMAVEYAWCHSNQFQAILFVVADSPMDLDSNLARLTGPHALDLPEQALEKDSAKREAVIRWLNQNDNWLLILDNVDELDAAEAVEAFICQVHGGQFIITSRLTEWSGEIQTNPLGMIVMEDAVDFLMERTAPDQSGHVGRRFSENESEYSKELAKMLGGLPLALEQAAAYIRKRRLSIEQYLEEYQHNHDKVLQWYDKRTMKYPKSIATTWLTTMQKLGPIENTILRITGFLAPDPIPVSMFKAGEVSVTKAWELLCEEIGMEPPSEDADFRDAIAELANYSMVAWPDDAFTVHRMVQDVLRTQVPKKYLEKWFALTQQMVESYGPINAHHPSTWVIWDILRPHAEVLIEYADESAQLNQSLVLLSRMAELYFGKYMLNLSLVFEKKALEIAEQQFDDDDLRLAHRLINYGESLRELGHHEKSEQIFIRAMEIDSRAFGMESTKVADDWNYIGLAQSDQGKNTEAEQSYRRALKIYDTVEDSDPIRVAMVSNNLGALLADAKKFEEAEVLMRKAVDIGENKGGESHHCFGQLLSRLANLVMSTGRKEEAIQIFSRAIEETHNRFGPKHLMMAFALNNYALCLLKVDHAEKAESLLRQSVEIRQLHDGAAASTIANGLCNHARSLRMLSRHDEAEQKVREAIKLWENSKESRTMKAGRSFWVLATILTDTKRYEEASQTFQTAFDIFNENNANDHEWSTDAQADYNKLRELVADSVGECPEN